MSDGVSLWWNGASGGVTYRGGFKLFYIKPHLPLIPNEYTTISFHPDSNLDDLNCYYIGSDKFGISVEEEQALNAVASQAFAGGNDGAPPLVQCKELVDIVTLVPTNPSVVLNSKRSNLTMTLMTEFDGTYAVRYDLNVVAEVVVTSTTANTFKTFNLKLDGLLEAGQYVFTESYSIEGVAKGADSTLAYDYRANIYKERSDNLEFFMRGASSKTFTAKCHFNVSFIMPNSDTLIGIPFPELGVSYSTKQRIFTDKEEESDEV